MQGKPANVTMKDVAKEAGVALGTVSKVLNGIPVGEEYRLRVEAAVKKLNYRVNTYAKGMKSGKTSTIAVQMPNLVNPYFSLLAHELSVSLSEHGQKMLLYLTDYSPRQEQEYVTMAEQQKVDGIICLSYNPNLAVSAGVPFVSIDRYFGAGVPCVACDNFGGGRMAAQKLADLGCTSVAFLRVGSNLTNEPNKRKDGFAAGCAERGISCTMKILDDATPHEEFERFLRGHLHDGRLDFDGIFCVTDMLCHQIVGYLRALGLRVPEDVQVIGFDGIRAFGTMEYICSTICQPAPEIARTCVDMVLGAAWPNVPTLVCLPVSYGFGGTTRE